jgi:Sugar (and other) transporter
MQNLLLFTLPFLGICLFWAGFSFYIPMTETLSKARLGSIATSIYLFCVFYSPGAGPVPFTFSAEAYPLHARASGMSLATATTWGFNGALAITWPSIHRGLGSVGAFCLYGTFNLVLWFAVLLLVPETKGRTLEQLDEVFNVPTKLRASWGLRQAKWNVQKYILRRQVPDLVPAEQLWAEEKARTGAGSDGRA